MTNCLSSRGTSSYENSADRRQRHGGTQHSRPRDGYSQHELITPRSRELDLTDGTATEAYIADVRPDIIIHAAGRVGGIQANMAHPVEFLVENLDMGRNIVMAARTAGTARLINIGSSCMYPRAAPNPLEESAVLTGELEPTNEGYALAKVMTARLCDYVRQSSPELAYKTLIPCNIFGIHDKFDPAVSHLLPAIIRKVDEAARTGAEAASRSGAAARHGANSCLPPISLTASGPLSSGLTICRA